MGRAPYWRRAPYRVALRALLGGGQVQVRKLQIAVSGYIKGFLDWELLNESFPHNDGGLCGGLQCGNVWQPRRGHSEQGRPDLLHVRG